MKKVLKNNKKNKLIKSASIIVFFTLILIVIISVYTMPSFKSVNPVVDNTVLFDNDLFFTYEINKYPTSVEISNAVDSNLSIGFSLDSASLNFGVVPVGGNIGKRFLTLTNLQESEAKMVFVAYGNISDMVGFNDNKFYLMPGVVKEVEIMLETKDDTQVGDYSGEINLVVKRSRYKLFEWLL